MIDHELILSPDIADVDGMFSSSSRAPAQPTKSEPVKR